MIPYAQEKKKYFRNRHAEPVTVFVSAFASFGLYSDTADGQNPALPIIRNIP